LGQGSRSPPSSGPTRHQRALARADDNPGRLITGTTQGLLPHVGPLGLRARPPRVIHPPDPLELQAACNRCRPRASIWAIPSSSPSEQGIRSQAWDQHGCRSDRSTGKALTPARSGLEAGGRSADGVDLALAPRWIAEGNWRNAATAEPPNKPAV